MNNPETDPKQENEIKLDAGGDCPSASCSPILLMFKATKKTNHFNVNQKLWVVRLTGAMAAHVRGKYRGKGRYVKAWVKWDKKGDAIPEIKEVPVTPAFYAKMRGDAESDEGYARIFPENANCLSVDEKGTP